MFQHRAWTWRQPAVGRGLSRRHLHPDPRAQERLAVANEQVTTQQRLVDTIELQYRKGTAAELQLRQAEGVLAQAQGAVPVLQIALDQALDSLDVLMGAQLGAYRAQLSAPAAIPKAPAITNIGS